MPGLVSLLVSWLPFIGLIAVWIFLSRQMQTARPGPAAGGGEVEGLKRRLDDMQKEIDELHSKNKS